MSARRTAALPERPTRAAAHRLLPPRPPATHGRTGRPGQIPAGHAGGLARLTPGSPTRVDPSLAPGFDAAPDDGVASGRGVPDLDETGDGGERDEDEEDPEHGYEDDGAQEGDAEQEHALAPLHETALGREPERLRLGPFVGHERGHRQDPHGQQREVAVAVVQ